MHVLPVALASMAVVSVAAASGRGEQPLSPYGVCAHLPRGDEYPTARRELRLMREAGIGWARADFSWSGVLRKPGGEWDFKHLDDVVRWAEAEGVRILPILDYDTPWARPAHEHLDQWLEFVGQVVGRYKDRIRYWEVWNEPNLEQFWHDKPSAENYVKLLRATYKRIKQIDPKLVVLLGGTAGIPWGYLEGVYKAGARESFDVMNVHPYRYPRSPEEAPLFEDLLRLRRMMSEQGDAQKPVWITEIGWPTHQGRRGVSPERQAEMLARAYLLSLQAGVEVVFWYEFQAMENKPDYNEDHFGIVHRDLRPKPAYTALKTLAGVRPAGSKKLDRPWRAGDVFCPAWQRPDGQTAWALWRPGKPEDRTLRVKGEVRQAVGHLGEPLTLKRQGQQLTVRPGEGPLYLVGPEELEVLAPKARAVDEEPP